MGHHELKRDVASSAADPPNGGGVRLHVAESAAQPENHLLNCHRYLRDLDEGRKPVTLVRVSMDRNQMEIQRFRDAMKATQPLA